VPQGGDSAMPVGGESVTPLRRATKFAVRVGAFCLAVAALIKLTRAPLNRGPAGHLPAATPPGADVTTVPPSSSEPALRLRAPTPDGSPSGWYGCAILLIAVLFAGVSVFAYNWLNHWYLPVNLRATITSLGPNQQLVLRTPGKSASVHWKMVAGFVGTLTVGGPSLGRAEVVVPIPVSDCGKMAAMLNTKCAGGRQLMLRSPAEFRWSSPQFIDSTNGTEVSAGFEIDSSATRHGVDSVTIYPQTALPSVCFRTPLSPAALTISVGQRSYPWHFSGTAGASCGQGISVLVGSAGSGMPPAFELAHVTGLTVSAWGPTWTVQGFTGQLALRPAGTTNVSSPTLLALRSQQNEPLYASLQIGQNAPLLSINSKAATSVSTSEGELVPTVWSRENAILVPLLGGFVTAAVVAPLGVSLQVLMDAIKRWRGPFQRRHRRGRGGTSDRAKDRVIEESAIEKEARRAR
jgi:hypothetical protein